MISLVPDRRESARRVLPHNLDAEAGVLGGVLLRNEVLDRLTSLEVDDFYDHRHKVVFQGIRALQRAERPIDVVTLETEIEKTGKLDAIGGIAYLGELAGRVPSPDNVAAYAETVQLLSRNRRVILGLGAAMERAWTWQHDPVELLVETMGSLQRLDAEHMRRSEPAAKPEPPPWRFAPELVDRILERAQDPWIGLRLGDDELVRVRAGGTAVVIGGTGSGKTSLVLCMMTQHARDVGVSIVLSIELPDEEAGARIVGQRCDASWEDALRGKVAEADMRRELALPRMYVLERRRATIANLELAVDDARRRFPGLPILVAIDYAQLLDSKEREVRMRVADAFAQIDDAAREKRFVAIALSQMSRQSTTKARGGDAVGTDGSSLGAETGAIERFATTTITIGLAAAREDGSEAVEVSVGKARMSKGDRVVPMTYWGRTGKWLVAGASKSAAEVRENRATDRRTKAAQTIKAALLGSAAAHPEPLSRSELKAMVEGRAQLKQAGLLALLSERALVEVMRKVGKGVKRRDAGWKLWTPDLALKAGIEIVPTSSPQGELPS